MPHFRFAYHGGMQTDPPEETEVEIERWRDWFDRIGPAIGELGNPVGAARTVSAEGVRDTGGDNPLSGYKIIHDESIDQALNWRRPARSSATAASRSPRFTRYPCR